MNTDVLFSSHTDEWETPQNLFDKLNRVFRFDLDTAASDSNHKVDNYFTKEQNGLLQDWTGHVVWCNPPYGRHIGEWVEKASNAVDMGGDSTCVVMLIPARTDTKWYHDYIYSNPRASVRFIRGRLRFGGSNNNAPFPSMIVVFI